VVLILGFGSGLAIAFIVSQLKPVVLSASQLKSAFGIPIFGTVTHFEAEKYTKIDRRRMIVFSTSSTVIVVLFSGLVWAEVVFGRVPFELLEKLL
jgi:hypothetical protein